MLGPRDLELMIFPDRRAGTGSLGDYVQGQSLWPQIRCKARVKKYRLVPKSSEDRKASLNQ